MKENKSMTPVLCITMLAMQEIASDFRTLFRELIKDDFTQSELGMIQFIHREGLCVLALFLVVFFHF